MIFIDFVNDMSFLNVNILEISMNKVSFKSYFLRVVRERYFILGLVYTQMYIYIYIYMQKHTMTFISLNQKGIV